MHPLFALLASTVLALSIGAGPRAIAAEPPTAKPAAESPPVPALDLPPGVVKWHPGHYVYLGFDDDEQYMAEMLKRSPRFRGVKLFHVWRTLEPQKDQYDFSRIRAQLAKAERLRTRVVLYVEVQTYHDGRNYTPDYITGPEYGGGTYRTPIGGINPVWWNAAVAARIGKLYEAIGREFNRHPRLEGFTTMETSTPIHPNDMPTNIERHTNEGVLQASLVMVKAMHDAFPNTVTVQFTNYPLEILPGLTDAIAHSRVGLGGPDIFLGSKWLRVGVYTYYPKLAGIVPLGTAVQWDNYAKRDHRGPVDDPPILELYRYGRDRLRNNYLYWDIRREPKDYFADVVKALNDWRFPTDPAGGLATACPKNFSRCVTVP
jgi:hypothetical protein